LVVIMTASRLSFGQRNGLRWAIGTKGYFMKRIPQQRWGKERARR
jgi:hypothetical protein